jgi:hypothetical protein
MKKGKCYTALPSRVVHNFSSSLTFSQLHQCVRTPSNCTGPPTNTVSNMYVLYTNAHITLNNHPSKGEREKKNVMTSVRKKKQLLWRRSINIYRRIIYRKSGREENYTILFKNNCQFWRWIYYILSAQMSC